MELSNVGTENMQVCTLCSTSQLVQWLHQSRVIWTSSFGHCLLHSVRQDSVANKQSISSYIRPNQKCSKYFGSASSYRRSCQYFPSLIQDYLFVWLISKQSALDTGEHIRSRTHFIPITTSGMDGWHRNSWDLKFKHHRGTWLPNQAPDFIS